MLTATLLALTVLTPLKVQERVIAGGPRDFMTARFLRLDGTNEEIGEKLAEIAQRRHGVEAATSDEVMVKRRLAWLKKNWPENYARAMGAARAFDKKPAGFDPTSLNYNADLKPGCSVVFYPGSAVTNGHSMLSRNYDFNTLSFAEMVGAPKPKGARAFTADPYVIEMHPEQGYASLYIAAYDLLAGCIDGINEKGLAVALLADDQAENRQPSEGIGLTEIRLTRFLLDRCATASEARVALQNAPFNYAFIPCHYMICDAKGESFVWEITPDLKRRFVVDGKGKPQIVTNHLLSQFDATHLPEGNSFDRYRRLQQEIRSRNGKVTPEEAGTINSCVAVPGETPTHATLWHSVYDLKARTMKVNFFLGKTPNGGERHSGYVSFNLSSR
jgi:penicillin V acylase-like amidase (Ntn superfamily)